MNRLSGSSWPSRLLLAAWAALLPVCTLFLFGPMLIYLPNSQTFSYMLDRVPIKFVPVALLAWLALFAGLASLPQRFSLRQRLTALSLTVGVLLWLQAHLINWQYGVLDGRMIDWHALAYRGWIDGAVWLFGLLAAWILADKLLRHAAQVVVFIVLLQAFYVGILFIQHAEARQTKNFMLFDESVRFRFSASRNAVVLISDGFQSDLFQELIEQEPKLKETFSGFTYFRNALAGFPLTTPSVPYMLTGVPCDNSLPFADYLHAAYRAPTSLLQALRRSDWRTDILMDAGGSFDKDPALISNLKSGQVPLTNRQAGFLFDLTLFRHAPHFLKRIVYAGQRWRFLRYLRDSRLADGVRFAALRNPVTGRPFMKRALAELRDVNFLAAMDTEAAVACKEPVFKLYHLLGVHPPLLMNERLEYETMRNNRSDWKRLARGNLAIIGAFLDRLRRLGILDSTFIVIMGDHGASLGQFGLRLPTGWQQTTGKVAESVRAAALPLVLVKRPGENGLLQVNDAPVTLGDLPATLLQSLGIASPGVSMFTIDPSIQRQRRFSYFVWNPGDAGKPYLPPLTHYLVNGHSWLADSWSAAGK